jgi:gliding motility-associated-like protein
VNALTGTAIAGATNLSYVPPTSATGTLYYYCIATYPNGGCGSATSNIAQVIVNPIQTITTQPLASQDICRGGAIAPLTVAYTDGVGTATYQWYSNTTNANTGGSSISGANGSSYTPPVFNILGDYYYYAMVSLSGSGCGSVASATALVRVVTDPIVTITPSSQTICQGTTPTNLVVTPSGGVGTFSYQWYSNTTNNTTTGTLITGANTPTYTPPNSIVGIKYYYCIITQSGLGCAVTSTSSQVIIVAVPTISNQPLATQTICQNDPSTPLSVTVINGTGIPTYQWYSNTTNSIAGGTAIAGATNATYSPSTIINDTKYYYCIIQYSAGGCGSLTTNISIVIVNSIAFIPNKTVTICSGASFNISPSGSVLPEIVPTGTQYTWFVNPTPNSNVSGYSDMLIVPQSNITQTLTNNGAIPYNVVYNVTPITGNCQGLPFTITVTVNPKVKPNVTINNVICNSNPPFCNGSILLAPTGGTPFNYQWSVTGTTPTQTNLCSGNYWVDITDSYSCTYRFNYTVTVPPPMISVPAVNPINNTNCDIATGCNGIIQVAVSGGTPFASTTNPYQYQWFQVTSSGNVPINTSLAQGNISILQNICGGTYYLVVTDIVNCQKQFGPYTITDPAPLVITSTLSNYNGFQVSCNGGNNGSIGINVTGGNGPINVILNPLGPNTITLPNPANFSGLPAGNYTVVIRDLASNCPDIIRNIVLTAPPALQATVTQTAAILCNGNFATYQAVVTGGIPFTTGSQYQYLWTPSNEITSSATNLPAGSYNVLVTDANGCTFNGSGVITQPSLLVATANITTPIRCFGGTATVTVTATGGVPNTTSGSPVYSGTGVFTVSAGVNVFTVTDFNGCQKSITINVTEPPLLQVTAVVSTPISCFGGNATVTVSAIGGVQNYTGTGTFSVPAGNNIPFTVTDANGCSNTVFLNITQPTLLVASATVTSPILCNGGTGVITISGVGGTPFATGSLYSGTGPITVSAGSGTYTISDANGCSASVPFTITQPTPVIATATIISPILCKGGTAIISVGATGGVPGSGYVGTGNYTVYAGTHTYFVRDSNGCISNTVTIVVTEPPLLVASSAVTSPVLCNGGTAVVTVTATGGTPLYTINAGDYGNYTVTAGLHLYTVIDANGCRSSTSITVTQPGPLAFTIKSATNPNCFPNRLYNNGSICISITGGTNPFPVGPGWVRSTNISTPNDWCLNGLSAGTYTIAIADVNNCPANTRTLTLTRPTPITGFITSNLNVNCPVKNVSQTNYIFASGGIPGYVYNWSGGVPCAGPPNPQCMTTDINGNYFVDVNDQEGITFGCIPVQFPVVVNLPVIGNPLMNISSSAMSICGVYSINDPISFTNVSTGNFTSIEWFVDGVSLAGANSVSHTFTTIGDHNITLVVNYTIGGVTCTYSITQTIAVTRGYDMIVPNAFTPANHDGINDNFKPEYNCMKELEMRVYDTWGSLLYVESGPTLKGWDGTINGHESENGNYIIVVRATTLFGAIVDYNGPFTLIK